MVFEGSPTFSRELPFTRWNRRPAEAGPHAKTDRHRTWVQDPVHLEQPTRKGKSGKRQTYSRFQTPQEGQAPKTGGNRRGEKARQGGGVRSEHSSRTALAGRRKTGQQIFGQGIEREGCADRSVGRRCWLDFSKCPPHALAPPLHGFVWWGVDNCLGECFGNGR